MPLTPEQIRQMDSISGLGAPNVSAGSKLTSEQITQMDAITGLDNKTNGLSSALARTGRDIVAGLGGIADIGYAAVNPIYKGMRAGLNAAGVDVGAPQDTQKYAPSAAIKAAYDKVTNNAGLPQNSTQAIVDKAAEFLAGGVGAGLASKSPQIAASGQELLKFMSPQTIGQGASLVGAGGGAELAKQTFPNSSIAPALGALVGGSIPAAKGGLQVAKNVVEEGAARVGAGLTPMINDDIAITAKKAIEYGIPLTRTQIGTSDPAKMVASAMGKLPLGGAGGFAKDQQKAFNREVLSTIGVNSEKASPSVLAGSYQKIVDGFNNALKGQKIKFNDNMIEKLIALERNAASELGEKSNGYEIFTNQVSKFLDYLNPDGTFKGEHLGNLRSALSKLSASSNDKSVRGHIADLKNFVQDVSVDGSPVNKEILQDSINKFRNYQVLKPLFSKARNGDISTSLLLGQVSKNFNDFERGGGGKLGDLARISRDLLKDTIPDSATAQRSLAYKALTGTGTALAAGGAAAVNPTILAGAAAPLSIAQVYNRINQSQRLAKNALGVKSPVKIPKEIYNLPPAVAIKAIQELQGDN